MTLITMTRRLAGQLRIVFRKALSITRGSGPALHFVTGPDGIRVRARSGDAAVEYHEPGNLPQQEMWVPFDMLGDVEARKDDPVELTIQDDGHATANWQDGNVPQMTQYDLVRSSDVGSFPELPKQMTENPPQLLRALHDAMETTDPGAVRYALECVQLRGKTNSLAATDGRQVLIDNGFDFPWDDEVLIRRTKFFGSKDVTHDEPVTVGRTKEWVTIRVGPWTLCLKIQTDGRFPDVDCHVPSVASAVATCRLSVPDASFLIENLPRMPGDDEYNLPVTLDLNGSVIVRGKSASQPQPTELVLIDSTATGEPMRINTNRRYLARAAQLGLTEVCLFSPETPAMACDEHRRYVWALLEPGPVIKPAKNATRITSPATTPAASPPKRQPQESTRTMPQPNNNSNGHATQGPTSRGRANQNNGKPMRTRTTKAGAEDLAGLIDQTEALRESLRDTLAKTQTLLKGLKQHRRTTRTLENTLASIRQLKTLGV